MSLNQNELSEVTTRKVEQLEETVKLLRQHIRSQEARMRELETILTPIKPLLINIYKFYKEA